MSQWKTYNLGDFAEINPKISLKQGNEYSFVEMKDLDATFKYVNPSTKKELKGGAKFQNCDTLFARITPCLENGKICQVKNLENNVGFGSTEFLVFRGKENISNSDFVYYLSRSEYVKNNAIQMMTGTSGRQRVEKSALEELEITVPDLATQTQIAQILTSLDDKIELNLQMNQTLEAMAQALFKEWFVNFNFPNFDGVLENDLPKGWRMGKVKEMYKTTSGGTPSRAKEEYYANGTVNWVKSKELNGSFIFDTEEKITVDAVKNSSAKLIPKYSVLVAMYGATVGEYAITTRDTTCNQAICAVIEEGGYPFTYFFEYFKINKNNIIGQASGSAQQNISQALIQQLDILVPTTEVVKEYHSIVKSVFIKMENNLLQIQTLTQTRDTLLPKLMSGKLEIKN
jgi:type I restriction enzyme, S subunit